MIELQDQVSDSYRYKGGEPEASGSTWDDMLAADQRRIAEKAAAAAAPAQETPPEAEVQAPAPDSAQQGAPGTGEPGAPASPAVEGGDWSEKGLVSKAFDILGLVGRPTSAIQAFFSAPMAGLPPEENEKYQDAAWYDPTGLWVTMAYGGKMAWKELMRPAGAPEPEYLRKFTEHYIEPGLTSQFLGTAGEVLLDPGILAGGVLGPTVKGAAKAAEMAGESHKLGGAGGAISRGLMKVFTLADVDLDSSVKARKAVELAGKAELGSNRAAKKLQEYLGEHFPDAFRKFKLRSIEAEVKRLGFYHVPLRNEETGEIITDSLGRIKMSRRPPPVDFIAKEKKLTDQRALGSIRLLRRELAQGKIISRPFKYRESYLDINTPADVDNLMKDYASEAVNYINKAKTRVDASGQKWINDNLSVQRQFLERELGDKINLPISNEEAFGLRMMIRDLGQGIKATIAAGGTAKAGKTGQIAKGIAQGYKFQGLIDHLRFWKLVVTRETLRSTLSGTKLNSTGAFSRINTRAPGNSAAVRLLQVSRAQESIPKPAPDKVQLIADQLSRLGNADATNAYLNKMFSPGGMKITGETTPEHFKVLNKVLSFEDRAFGAYVDALLSNPLTHAKNILDTGSLMLYQDIKEFAATIPGMARMSPDALMHAQAGMARMHGHIEAIGDMFRIWKQEAPRKIGNMKDFVDLHEVVMGRNSPQLSPRALENASKLTRMADRLNHARPTSMLGKADAALKSVEYRAALRANAVKKAHAVSGGDWKMTRKLYEEFVDSPLEQMKMESFLSAEKYTYQQPYDPSKWFEREVLRKLSGTPFVRFTAPFVRTPYQILKRGMDEGPLTVFSRSTWNDLLAGGARMDDAIAKVGLAGSGLLYVAMSSNSDVLTGGIGGVQNAWGQWHLSNYYDPYSVGGKDFRFSLQNLGPIKWIAGSAANLRDLAYFTDWNSLDGPDMFSRAVSGAITSMVDPISDSFFLSNFVDTIDAFSYANTEEFVPRLAKIGEQLAMGYATPGALRASKQIFDDRAREATTFIEKIMAATPGLSDNLPERTDVLGYPLSRPYWHNFSPMLLDPKNTSPVASELRRVNAIIRDIPDDFKGLAKFTSEERAGIRELRSKGFGGHPGLEDVLALVMRRPEYKQATVEEKADILQSQISAYSNAAMEVYIRSNRATELRIREAEMEMLEKRAEAMR